MSLTISSAAMGEGERKMIKVGDRYIVQVKEIIESKGTYDDAVIIDSGSEEYHIAAKVSASFINTLPKAEEVKAEDTAHYAWNLARTIALMPKSMITEKFHCVFLDTVVRNHSYEEAKAIVDVCRREYKRTGELSKIHMAVKKAMKENNKTCKEEDLVRFINSLNDIKD